MIVRIDAKEYTEAVTFGEPSANFWVYNNIFYIGIQLRYDDHIYLKTDSKVMFCKLSKMNIWQNKNTLLRILKLGNLLDENELTVE
jgi:hypothetical protein